MSTLNPLYLLRKQIREARAQYRHNNDNSESLFHPKRGFVLAYDIQQVEDALNAFEEATIHGYFPQGMAPVSRITLQSGPAC